MRRRVPQSSAGASRVELSLPLLLPVHLTVFRLFVRLFVRLLVRRIFAKEHQWANFSLKREMPTIDGECITL